MPTGYTYPVEEGEITTLQEFALRCARAFGGFMHMRDEPMDAPLRRDSSLHTNSYHQDCLAKSLKELKELENLSEEDLAARTSRYNLDRIEEYEERLLWYNLHHSRYVSMLEQVQNWKVPSSLQTFREFLLDQLKISMEGMYPPSVPTELSKERYLETVKEPLEWSIVYHKEEIEKEKGRVTGRDAWIDDLFTALDLPLLPK